MIFRWDFTEVIKFFREMLAIKSEEEPNHPTDVNGSNETVQGTKINMAFLPEDEDWKLDFSVLARMRIYRRFFSIADEEIILIKINEKVYRIKYFLKKGTTVYISEDQDAVVKEYRGARICLARYEIAATKFYQEEG
jgi:hypothetical protein